MNNKLKEAIDTYAQKVCMDSDDIVEILYSMCSNCPISVATSDKLSLHLELPDNSTLCLFTFETTPVSMVLDVDLVAKMLPEHGIFPFEANELFGVCSFYAIESKDRKKLYLDLKQVLMHLHDITTSIKGFVDSIYIAKP